MKDQVMARVIELLQTDPEFFVPIRKLWLTLQREGLALDLTQEDLHQTLLADEQFEFISDWGDDAEALAVEIAEQLEPEKDSGFYSGPRVKLVARIVTTEDIFTGLAQSVSRMNEALQSAWDTRPGADPEAENQLLTILAAGQKLETEINDLIDEKHITDEEEEEEE